MGGKRGCMNRRIRVEMRTCVFDEGRDPSTPPFNGIPLLLLAGAFFGWLAAPGAYPVLDFLAARLAGLTSTGLAHRNLLPFGWLDTGGQLAAPFSGR